MRLPRFRIASLLALIVFIAVAVAALRASDPAWDSGLFGMTLLILLASVLLAVHRDGPRRAFWLGFALFGWVSLVASLIPPIEARLPTSRGLIYLDSKIPSHRVVDIAYSWVGQLNGNGNSLLTYPAVIAAPNGQPIATTSQGGVRIWNVSTGAPLAGPFGSTESFVRIGHSLIALVMAFLGGHLSRFWYAGRSNGTEGQP